jgi:hypothetical protein
VNGAGFRFLAAGSLRYLRSAAKHAVKSVLGRPHRYTDADVLYRQYMRHLLGGPPIARITCICSTLEGAGSQALLAMRAIQFARAHGLTYCHTPFRHLHHADRPMPEWAAAWEAQFNLGAGEATDTRDAVNFAFTFPVLHALFGVSDDDTPFDETLVEEFRRRYRLNKPRATKELPSVCIHIRRRNRHDFHAEDSSDMACVAAVVTRLRRALHEQELAHTLRVFSQGDRSEFRALELPDDCLFLDADPIWSMREMIDADLLVTTRGTFSHVTGLLCEGIVLADGSFPPQPGWLTYDGGGAFDGAALASAVSAKIRSASGR